jgi:hypothetical protein
MLAFIERIILWDPDSRLTPEEALNDPWITGIVPTPNPNPYIDPYANNPYATSLESLRLQQMEANSKRINKFPQGLKTAATAPTSPTYKINSSMKDAIQLQRQYSQDVYANAQHHSQATVQEAEATNNFASGLKPVPMRRLSDMMINGSRRFISGTIGSVPRIMGTDPRIMGTDPVAAATNFRQSAMVSGLHLPAVNHHQSGPGSAGSGPMSNHVQQWRDFDECLEDAPLSEEGQGQKEQDGEVHRSRNNSGLLAKLQSMRHSFGLS